MNEHQEATAMIEELALVEPRIVAWLDGDRQEPDDAPEDEPPEAA